MEVSFLRFCVVCVDAEGGVLVFSIGGPCWGLGAFGWAGFVNFVCLCFFPVLLGSKEKGAEDPQYQNVKVSSHELPAHCRPPSWCLPPWDQPFGEHFSEFFGHIIWMWSIEVVRRDMRNRITGEPDAEYAVRD